MCGEVGEEGEELGVVGAEVEEGDGHPMRLWVEEGREDGATVQHFGCLFSLEVEDLSV